MSFKIKLGQAAINVPMPRYETQWNCWLQTENDKTITWLTVVNYKHHLCRQFCHLKEKPMATTQCVPLYVWKESVYLLEWGVPTWFPNTVNIICQADFPHWWNNVRFCCWWKGGSNKTQIIFPVKETAFYTFGQIKEGRRDSFSFYLQQIKGSF